MRSRMALGYADARLIGILGAAFGVLALLVASGGIYGVVAYEAARRPTLEKLVSGANGSATWYEHFAEHMRLAPVDFAMSYITRSGRVDIERLRKLSPRFVAQFERDRATG